MHSTKIDQAKQKVQQLREELHAEVEEEVQANIRRRRWREAFVRCGGCCGVSALGLLFVTGVLAYGVARTGLIVVPVLSARVAHERAPMRVVDAPYDSLLSFDPATLLPRAVRDGRTNEFTLPLTERELTSMLRAALVQGSNVHGTIGTSLQVIATNDALELFVRVPSFRQSCCDASSPTATLLVRGMPRVAEDGTLTVDVSHAEVGTVPVPSFLVSMLLSSMLRRFEFPLELRAVSVEDGQVTIRAAAPSAQQHVP